jgi:hypothetical protein
MWLTISGEVFNKPMSFCSTCCEGDRQERVSSTRVSSAARIFAKVSEGLGVKGVRGDSFTVVSSQIATEGEISRRYASSSFLRWRNKTGSANPDIQTRNQSFNRAGCTKLLLDLL